MLILEKVPLMQNLAAINYTIENALSLFAVPPKITSPKWCSRLDQIYQRVGNTKTPAAGEFISRNYFCPFFLRDHRFYYQLGVEKCVNPAPSIKLIPAVAILSSSESENRI